MDDLHRVFAVIESVKSQLTHEIERGLRNHDIQKATWALAGKDACDRIRNGIQYDEKQKDFATQRDEEMIEQQKSRATRRAEQRAIRDSQKIAAPSPQLDLPLTENPSPVLTGAPDSVARNHIRELHQSRKRLLRAIDARQFQNRKSG